MATVDYVKQTPQDSESCIVPRLIYRVCRHEKTVWNMIWLRRWWIDSLLPFRLIPLLHRKTTEMRILQSQQISFYVFEIIIAIIVVTLCSVLAQEDDKLANSIYRYFIADGIVSLIVLFLFITTIINFEKRNGRFYCLVAALMTFASFIIAIAVLKPSSNCANNSICTMRKAAAGFAIISFCLWLSNLDMLLTTYYISNFISMI